MLNEEAIAVDTEAEGETGEDPEVLLDPEDIDEKYASPSIPESYAMEDGRLKSLLEIIIASSAALTLIHEKKTEFDEARVISLRSFEPEAASALVKLCKESCKSAINIIRRSDLMPFFWLELEDSQ